MEPLPRGILQRRFEGVIVGVLKWYEIFNCITKYPQYYIKISIVDL